MLWHLFCFFVCFVTGEVWDCKSHILYLKSRPERGMIGVKWPIVNFWNPNHISGIVRVFKKLIHGVISIGMKTTPEWACSGLWSILNFLVVQVTADLVGRMILTSLIACKIYYLRRGCVDKTISLSISEIVKDNRHSCSERLLGNYMWHIIWHWYQWLWVTLKLLSTLPMERQHITMICLHVSESACSLNCIIKT